MTSQAKRIGKNLKEARRALSLSQEDVARLAGVSSGTVAKYEQGKTENPRGAEFEAVAGAVGKTTEELRGVVDLGDSDDESSDDFQIQLARRYGPENAEFVDEVARKIKEFPPREAAFIRHMLIGAVHGARPFKNSPDGPAHLIDLVRV